MVLIGIANGAIRERWYAHRVGELAAHQISTLSAALLLGVYIWWCAHLAVYTSGQALIIGLIWLGLTMAIEFLFGHYVAGLPWSKLLDDYNVFAGRIWLVIPIWITAAPCLFYRLQK